MQQKIEITFPKELIRELEILTKDEGITINEFIFWAIGEKIGEIRMRRGIKNHQQNQSKPDLQNNPKTYSPNQLLRAVEVAKYLDISKPEVYLLIRNGKIPVIRIGRLVRVKFSDLENYIETNRK